MRKDDAIGKLERQRSLISQLKSKPRSSPEFKKWRRDTEVAIEKIFGKDTRHLEDFISVKYNPLMYAIGTTDNVFDETYRKGLDEAASVLNSLVDEVTEYWNDEPATPVKDDISLIERTCERFHLVVRQLCSRREDRETLKVEDEYDVQDLLHALLVLDFDDIRPEEWAPSYAGSRSRMDFLLKQEQIVVEAKKTRQGLMAKEVGEQLIVDIKRYQAHPDCQMLICFVYDPEGLIANPRGIENDLNGKHNGLEVKVIVAQ